MCTPTYVQILNERKAAEKGRLAFIIFLSDGKDDHFKDPDDIKENLSQLKPKYPIHAFGFGVSEEDSNGAQPAAAQALRTMADATSGSYTSITQDVDILAVAEKLDQLSDKLTSIVAVDVRIHLRSLHPAVSLLRIESSSSSSAGDGGAGDDYKSQIGDDKQSAEITVGAVSSGKEREFTVYLYVPEGQQGNDGGVTTMELLAVGGSYKQSWDDQEQVALGESVVTVARPPSSTSSCMENSLS